MIDKLSIISKLLEIYESSKISKNLCDIIERLDGEIKINNLVNYIINLKKYDGDDIDMMDLIIRILQNIYNNSDIESPVNDELYDKLYAIYSDYTNNDIVGSDVDSSKKDFHKYPDLRGTLHKVHFITNKEKGNDKRKSLQEWTSSCENKIGRKLSSYELDVALFPKFDGVSVIFECDKNGNVIKALTRGNTTNNEAIPITKLFKGVKFRNNIGWNSEFGVKTEIIMTYKNYDKYCKKYGKFKSPRSAVSSIINSIDVIPDYYKYISIIPLRMQNYDTKEIINHPDALTLFPVVYSLLSNEEFLRNGISTIREYMKKDGIPIDGIVIQLTDKNIVNILGREDAINRFEVAYKFSPEAKKTKLIDIEFSVGLLGAITPVAKIKPIKMDGNIIKNVSLGSIDRFKSLNLAKNDEVLIKYDIIPYLFTDSTCKKSGNDKIEVITHCPYCGHELKNEPILKCINQQCQSRVIGKIVNYLDKMDIRGISIGLVTTLYNHKYLQSIEDLYLLENHKKEISNIDGIGRKMIDNIIDGINSRKDVECYDMLGSLGIENVGRKIFKRILNIYYFKELIEICLLEQIERLTCISGIQKTLAYKIIQGVKQNVKTIMFLNKVLDIRETREQSLMKVLFTQVRDNDFENYLKSKNIEVVNNYSKEVDIVICENLNKTSSKLEKAMKHGKTIMTLDDAYKYFKYHQ